MPPAARHNGYQLRRSLHSMDSILGDYLWSLLAVLGVLAVTAAIGVMTLAFFKPELIVQLLSV
jgi:hypothetical protein